jgi:UDP-glucose 4-epimerase
MTVINNIQNSSNPRRALVTGGAGFIGSHLVERLLEDGHQVVVLDSFSSGNPNNLEKVKGHPSLSVMQGDIAILSEIESAFVGVEWVFHLAALADIVPSIEEPLLYHRSNVDGTVNVLEASRKAGVQRFIYAASSSCYGVPDEFPTPETAPAKPMYPYALTKYLGEQCVMHWNQVYQLPCVSLRLFNVYGLRARATGTYGAVFGVFLAQKLAGEPMTVVGDGEQTRDFTFVTDVAECFARAAASDIQGEIINVGSGGTYSINLLTSLLGGDVVHIPKRPGEPNSTFAGTRKAETLLGWTPKMSFAAGVQIMLDNIEKWRDAPVWDPDSISKATEGWFRHLAEPTAALNLRGNP